MASKIDLLNYDNGYWGYMSDDVKYTLGSLTSSISTTGHPRQILHISEGDGGGVFVLGSIEVAGSYLALGMINAADDAAAASAGVEVDEMYHTNGTVKIRLT